MPKTATEENVLQFDPSIAAAFDRGFTSGVTIGVKTAFDMMGITKPTLRREEAITLLKTNGFKPCVLDKWVINHKISEYKSDKRTSPREYSFNELYREIQKWKPIRLFK